MQFQTRVNFTNSVDFSELNRLIPSIVAFGRRTLREQCVTSAALICLDAQRNTAAASVGQIDSELEVEITGYTAKGRRSRAKRPFEKRVTAAAGVRVPLAVLIVMARTNPDSNYSRLTGNRWPLSLGMLPSGPGSGGARAAMIAAWVTRMTLSRHSSTHFLQHGWAPAIRTLLADPAYFAGKSKMQIRAQVKINPVNTLSTDELGQAVVELSGDNCTVMAENAVGGNGNEVLAAKHRAALIRFGTQPLQDAVDREAATMTAKIQEYLDRGLKQEFGNF